MREYKGYNVDVSGIIYSKQSNRKDKPLYLHPDKDGYLQVEINGKYEKVHKIVASIYVANPNNKPQIDHIDGNKSNNCADNLRWVTAKENCNNPTTIINRQGVKHPLAKKVYQYDIKGNLIRIYNYGREVSKYGFIYQLVSECA